jgi:hypothetical protein
MKLIRFISDFVPLLIKDQGISADFDDAAAE